MDGFEEGSVINDVFICILHGTKWCQKNAKQEFSNMFHDLGATWLCF